MQKDLKLGERKCTQHSKQAHGTGHAPAPVDIIKMQRIGCMSLLVVLLSVFGPLAGCVWLDSATHACRQAPCTSLAATTTTTALPWPGNRVHHPTTAARPGEGSCAVQCSVHASGAWCVGRLVIRIRQNAHMKGHSSIHPSIRQSVATTNEAHKQVSLAIRFDVRMRTHSG